MKYLAAALVLVGLAWFGMNQMSDAQTATAFTHSKDVDLQGYYIPIKEVRISNYKLNNISIGAPAELTKFEKYDKSDIPTYAPAMMQFDDTTSPTGKNELGQIYYETTERVLPSGYTITAKKFTFTGTGPGKTLGPVTFDAKPDLKKIKAARKNPARISDGAALVGTLTVGKTTIRNVELMWYGGE